MTVDEDLVSDRPVRIGIVDEVEEERADVGLVVVFAEAHPLVPRLALPAVGIEVERGRKPESLFRGILIWNLAGRPLGVAVGNRRINHQLVTHALIRQAGLRIEEPERSRLRVGIAGLELRHRDRAAVYRATLPRNTTEDRVVLLAKII